MSNPRFIALAEASKHAVESREPSNEKVLGSCFGMRVFNRQVMEKSLPQEVYQNVVDAMEARAKIKLEFADIIALAMKEWAISHGATHYTHWFQPLTGASAEKHDAFLDWTKDGSVLEQFSGRQLIQGEPDASSFPSGGLRSTYEARGYTGWDPTSPAFLWKGGDGVTLCIPSVFFSWTGEVLDTKIPLLRSDSKLNAAVLRLLRLTDIQATHVYSTLGLEQEYFVVDRSLRNLRPDLLLLGKTVYGTPPPKGQELQDHYLGPVKDRILAFMLDFETEAFKLGIPVKTRHNEVAPAQHEVAPVFEKASIAIDHNIVLMELMRHIAIRHNLSCLLHEKPFKGFNGSGKHSNWSLATDRGLNLLDPQETPGNNLHFLILLTAILSGVHRHAALLRASIGSASNDDRLGGHEAPPAIISVYLGQELEAILDLVEEGGGHPRGRSKLTYDLGLPEIPLLTKDNTDRNRTSPLAFTGNKFEFRAVGSSANPSFPITVMNAVVAECLHELLDEIEMKRGDSGLTGAALIPVALPVLHKYLKASKPIRFSGDNYSEAWKKEASSRKLLNLELSIDAFEALKSPETIEALEGILSEQELCSRYEVALETYLHQLRIEINLMLSMFRSQVLPTALRAQKEYATSIERAHSILGKPSAKSHQVALLHQINRAIEEAMEVADTLEKELHHQRRGSSGEQARKLVEGVKPSMEKLRKIVDHLEEIIDDQIWPLPKYRELLFVV